MYNDRHLKTTLTEKKIYKPLKIEQNKIENVIFSYSKNCFLEI